MRLRDRLRRLREWFSPRRLEDPAFGMIAFCGGGDGCWERDAVSDDYTVRVFAGEAGPEGEQRALFTEFKNRRPELFARIEQSLSDQYNTIRGCEQRATEEGGADVGRRINDGSSERQRPSEIWKIAKLVTVEVLGVGHPLDLCLMFEMDWGDPEHLLSVTIKDWKVVDVGKEG